MIDRYYIINDIVIFYIKRKRGEYAGEYECFIDLADFEKIKDLPLNISFAKLNRNNVYIKFAEHYRDDEGKAKHKLFYLHRWLLNSDERDIDHVNHNGLDNRRKNLRYVPENKNCTNRIKKNPNNKSGYRNVCFLNGFYRIQLQINGKNTMFKEKFTDVHEAGRFAKEMRELYYGEFAGDG